MKVPRVAFTLMALLSCASAGSPGANRDAPVEGTYDFVATVPPTVIRGTLRFDGDTMYFSSENCLANFRSEPIGRSGTGGVFRYGCSGAILQFDSRNPTRASKWSATVTLQRLREVCVETAVRNGREVCIRTQMDRYEVPETRSGSIQVTKRP